MPSIFKENNLIAPRLTVMGANVEGYIENIYYTMPIEVYNKMVLDLLKAYPYTSVHGYLVHDENDKLLGAGIALDLIK